MSVSCFRRHINKETWSVNWRKRKWELLNLTKSILNYINICKNKFLIALVKSNKHELKRFLTTIFRRSVEEKANTIKKNKPWNAVSASLDRPLTQLKNTFEVYNSDSWYNLLLSDSQGTENVIFLDVNLLHRLIISMYSLRHILSLNTPRSLAKNYFAFVFTQTHRRTPVRVTVAASGPSQLAHFCFNELY